MRVPTKILILLMAIYWFPITQHCTLEAVGVIPTTCPNEPGGCDKQNGDPDGCDVVENGAYKISSDVVKAPVPDLTVCACFLCLYFAHYVAPVETVFIPVATIDRPLDWVTTWQFARRAALPSRAPSLLCA